MKTETRRLGSSWKLTTALLTGGLLLLGPGCICINMQVTVPSGSSSGGGGYGGGQSLPIPAGGPLSPVPMPMTIESGTATVCNPAQTVSKTRVHFYPPSIQAPTTGETHFQGRIRNKDTGALIPKTHYVLQWWINVLPQNNGCAANVPGAPNDKKFPIQAGALYQITAHFYPNYVPNPMPSKIQLEGAWIY